MRQSVVSLIFKARKSPGLASNFETDKETFAQVNFEGFKETLRRCLNSSDNRLMVTRKMTVKRPFACCRVELRLSRVDW